MARTYSRTGSTYGPPQIKWYADRGMYGISNTPYKNKFVADIKLLTQNTSRFDADTKTWFFEERYLDTTIKRCKVHFGEPVVIPKDQKACADCSRVIGPGTSIHDPRTGLDYCNSHGSACKECGERIYTGRDFCYPHQPKQCTTPGCTAWAEKNEHYCSTHLYFTCKQCNKTFKNNGTTNTQPEFCSRQHMNEYHAARRQQRQSIFNRRTGGGNIEKFCREIGLEALSAAYKKAVTLYHPDINPSCNGKMAEINGLWEKVKEELKQETK